MLQIPGPHIVLGNRLLYAADDEGGRLRWVELHTVWYVFVGESLQHLSSFRVPDVDGFVV